MRNELIPKVLKEYRKRNHYSVKDVSIRLMEHDIDVAPKTIYGWESGQAQPTADTLLLLCEIYKIPDILNSFGYDQPDDPAASLTYHEREIIYAYRNRPELQHAVDILLGWKTFFVLFFPGFLQIQTGTRLFPCISFYFHRLQLCFKKYRIEDTLRFYGSSVKPFTAGHY